MFIESKPVDWEKEWEDWDLTCPICGGSGKKIWEELDEDERKQLLQEFKEWYEEEPESEDELKEYYEENIDEFDFHCEYCNNGYVETYWNYVWDVGYIGGRDVISDDVVRKIYKETNCMVLFNEAEERWYLTLSGCGMDLTPDLCYAWLLMGFKWLPLNWAMELRRDYGGGLSKEQHEQVIALAIETIENQITNLKHKLEALKEEEKCQH